VDECLLDFEFPGQRHLEFEFNETPAIFASSARKARAPTQWMIIYFLFIIRVPESDEAAHNTPV
jgi:hypothetical protein